MSNGFSFRRTLGLVLPWALFAAAVSPARADGGPADRNQADQLFEDGKALYDQGEYRRACEKLEASLAIARRGGVLLLQAMCREAEGKYATAERLYEEARTAAAGKNAEREAFAQGRLPIVHGKVSWLQIDVDGADQAGEVVLLDGAEVPRESWGKPSAIDAGEHRIRASAPGRLPFETTAVVGGPADRKTVRVPVLPADEPAEKTTNKPAENATNKPAEKTTNRPVGTSTNEPAEKAAEKPVAKPAWRTPLGGALAGVGLAALGVGAAVGIKALVDNGAAKGLCPGGACPSADSAGERLNRQALAEARASDVLLPVGAVLSAAGVYLLITGRSPAGSPRVSPADPVKVSVAFGPGKAAFALEGAF
jgi:hypothetical protein